MTTELTDEQVYGILKVRLKDHFGGLLAIVYPDIVGALFIKSVYDDAATTAQRVGEPVLLRMGPLEKLFTPGNLPPMQLQIPEGAHALSTYDCETGALLDDRGLKLQIIFSRAPKVNPTFNIAASAGSDLGPIRAHVARLQEKHGMRIAEITL